MDEPKDTEHRGHLANTPKDVVAALAYTLAQIADEHGNTFTHRVVLQALERVSAVYGPPDHRFVVLEAGDDHKLGHVAMRNLMEVLPANAVLHQLPRPVPNHRWAPAMVLLPETNLQECDFCSGTGFRYSQHDDGAKRYTCEKCRGTGQASS